MHVATHKQMKRLVQSDEKLAIRAVMAVSAINDLLDNWGDMSQSEVDNAAKHLQILLDYISKG